MVAAEHRRRPSRDNSASPPPTAVQTQQPQSTHGQVTDVNSQPVETASADAPPDDDNGTHGTASSFSYHFTSTISKQHQFCIAFDYFIFHQFCHAEF